MSGTVEIEDGDHDQGDCDGQRDHEEHVPPTSQAVSVSREDAQRSWPQAMRLGARQGANIEQSDAVLSSVVVSCRQVNPRRTRRVGDLDGRIQNRRTEDPERLLGTAEADIGAPGPWIECTAVRGPCGLG